MPRTTRKAGASVAGEDPEGVGGGTDDNKNAETAEMAATVAEMGDGDDNGNASATGRAASANADANDAAPADGGDAKTATKAKDGGGEEAPMAAVVPQPWHLPANAPAEAEPTIIPMPTTTRLAPPFPLPAMMPPPGVSPMDQKGKRGRKRKTHSDSDTVPSKAALGKYSLRKLNDADFVRLMTTEFKRRGYVVAMQIKQLGDHQEQQGGKATKGKPLGRPRKSAKKDDAAGAADTTAAAANQPSGAAEDAGDEGKTTVASTKATKAADEGDKSKYPTFQFYPSTTSVSAKNDAAWNSMFTKLKSYHEKNGGGLPLSTQPPPDDALFKWTRTQVNLWKRMKKGPQHNLTMDRIAKLHSVDFERGARLAREIQSVTMASVLEKQRKREGDSGGEANPGSEVADDDVQQAVEATDAALMPLGRNSRKWLERFEGLRRYKELHGDTDVPRAYDDALSKWCAVQRRRCKEFMDGDATSIMTQAQFDALISLGFDVDRKRKFYDRALLDQKWEDKFNELCQFKEKFGHCDAVVRKGLEEYKQLASWTGLQRRKYKAKQTGTKAGRTSEITDEQIKKLAAIGFKFSLQDDFETRFKNLLEFKKEFGHTKVPVFYTGYNNLGRWAKRMRDGIRENEPWVDEVKKTRLLGIDFDIAARHVFGHKPKNRRVEEEQGIMEGHSNMAGGVGEPVEAQAAATALAGMDNPTLPQLGEFGQGASQFFYHSYNPTERRGM